MTDHPFDQALALDAVGHPAEGHFQGTPSAFYWNMVGPYGGITAATVVKALMQHPGRLGDPIALTVNYAAALTSIPFTLKARAARTNRSTQHWTVEMTQEDAEGQAQVVLTATAVTAARRSTWRQVDHPMPQVPPPDQVDIARRIDGVAWLDRYEMRVIEGGLPAVWDGTGEHSRSLLWMRDNPGRVLDFVSLTSLSDLFLPRVWLRRATRVPVGTVSMTVYFHANPAELMAAGTDHVLGQAQAQAFHDGFFDQNGQIWSRDGHLLVTTHQIVYYKE
jgi:acyl-CoA thioesterase